MELKEFLLQNYSDETGAKDTTFELGYHGKPRNERFVITNEVQFAEALSLEQKGWLILLLCVLPKSTGIGEKGKRQHSAESKALSSKRSKGKHKHNLLFSVLNPCLFIFLNYKQSMDNLFTIAYFSITPKTTMQTNWKKQFQRLKEKHPRLPGFKLRVWAKMIR
jgi:NADH:ubiquinone oxidoreductase subunit